MSIYYAFASVFRVRHADLGSMRECVAFSCEVGKAAIELAVVTEVVVVGLAAFLAFTYIREAVAADQCERQRVLAERDAFEEFRNRMTSLDPAPTGPKTMEFGESMTAARTVDRVSGDDAKLRQVLAAYRDTVMAVPHYREEYDETISESLTAELGSDTAVALASNSTLSAASQSALVRRSRRAAEARSSLAEGIDDEIETLRAYESDLSCVDRRRRRLLEHLDGVSRPGIDAALDVWEELEVLEEECDEIAAERQEILADPPVTPDSAVNLPADHAFYEYLYEPTDGPRYPVLAQVSELSEQIRGDRDRVTRRIASEQ